MSQAMLYTLSLITSFCAVFLKGFQQKNVIGGHLRSVVFTSMTMAAFDVAAVSIIVKGGWSIAVTSGIGASAGIIMSIKVHDYLFKKES